jgi:tetratricopeptide (TPR) repeat protein
MNRKLSDIGKSKNDKNMLFLVLIILAIMISVLLLSFISTFIGKAYDNYHAGRAGYVYSVVLEYKECAQYWSGVYGAAVMVVGYNNQQSEFLSPCGMYDINLLFSCLQPSIDHEVYASLVPQSSIDWNTISAASPGDVDAYLGVDNTSLLSATRTFTQTASYQVGNMQYNVPATYTKGVNDSVPKVFDIGIMKDGNGNLIYIAHINSNFTNGFNGRYYNYQMILPIKENTTPEYFFFTDPNDQCPQGEGDLPNPGNIEGYVTTTSGDILENVIVDVAGRTTLTDTQGYYNLSVPQGSYYIFGIKSGYQAYVGNASILYANTTRHDFVMVLSAVPNPNVGPDIGPAFKDNDNTNNNVNVDVGPGQDVGPNDDVGPGEAPRVPIMEQPTRIEGIDYIISLSRIDRKLVVGNFLQEIISFYSYKKGIAELTFKIDGENISKMIKLDKETLSLAPNTNDQLTLTIFGEGVPGVYNGSLLIDGDMNASIPIRIELLSKERLSIESLLLMLHIDDTKLYSNQKLKFKTDLYNLLSDQGYPITLQYTVQDTKGKTVWSDISNVYLQTSFSLLRSADLPDNLPTGDYILRVTANYLGLASGSSQVFSIVLPFYEIVYLGLKVWQWLLIIVSLVAGVIAYFSIKTYIQSKKRYTAAVEYAELPKVGPKAAFVGKIAETEHKTYFDLEQFKVHTIVAGATGGGKSVSSQVVVEEALLKNIAVIVFDPTAQWSGMLRKCTDKNMLKLYPLFGLKPTQSRPFNGNVRQITNALEIIDIKKYIKPGEIQILALNKLDPKDIDIFVANSIREVFHANFPETPEIKLLLVYDEVHRLLPKFGGSGEGFLQIERGCREFRKWGIGILMISQVLADFMGQIKANINTEIQMRTRDEGDLDRIKTKYGTEYLQGLVKASVGSGMVENPTYNRGRPYFVSFRPLFHNTQRLSDDELEKYNKYNSLIDDLQYQIEQLEEEKQDVFDLKLQIKLSLDKVKSGNFNMVEIYLQEVTPRLDKMWGKLNKKPKKRELKLVDINSLKADLKKAEDSRKEFEKQNAPQQVEAQKEEKKVLKFDKTVDLSKALNLSNGLTVTSLQELLDVMPNITGPTLKHHVTKDKNDLADWVKNAIGDALLSEKLRQAKTNEEYVKILEEDKSKNNTPVSSAPVSPVVSSAPVSSAPVSSAPVSSPQNAAASSPASVVTSAVIADKVVADKIVSADNVSAKSEIKDDVIQESLAWKEIKENLNKIDDIAKILLLEKSVRTNPQDLNILFSLALLYHKTKKYDLAEKEYKSILSIYPSNTKAIYYLAGLLKTLKRYEESLSYFNNYLALRPGDKKVKDIVDKIKSKVKVNT